MPYAIARWSRTPDTWTHEYNFTTNKTLIQFSSDGEYKKFDGGTNSSYGTTKLVPQLSGYTSGNITVSASSEYSTTQYQAWKAFNRSNATAQDDWASSTTSGWLQVDFTNRIVVGQYELQEGGNTSTNYMPKDWTFEGSNDGTNWTVLDTQAGVTGWTGGEIKSFQFVNNISYRYYRINILSNNGAILLAIGEMNMYEYTPATLSSWQSVSTTLPTQTQFETDGMDDLSVFGRQSKTFTQDMTNDGTLGSGLKFSTTIDLKKYFDITDIRKI